MAHVPVNGRENLGSLRERLVALAERATALAEHAEAGITGALRRQERPDGVALQAVAQMADEFDRVMAVAESLGLSGGDPPSIPKLVAAVTDHERSADSVKQRAVEVLNRVLTISHASGEIPDALTQLHDKAGALREQVLSGNLDRDEVASLAIPYAAIISLLEAGPSLTADEEDELTEYVREGLGRSLVRPVFFRDLALPDIAVRSSGVGPARIGDAAPDASVGTAEYEPSPVAPDEDQPPAESATGIPAKINVTTDVKPGLETGTAKTVATAEQPAPETSHEHVTETALVPPLKQSIVTFEAFAKSYWINPVTGACEAAPWALDDFAAQLRSRSAELLGDVSEGSMTGTAELWIIATAIKTRGEPGVRPETIWQLAEILANPEAGSSGRDATRIKRLQDLPEGEEEELRLALVLEAIRPTVTSLPYMGEIDRLIEQARFRDGTIRQFITDLFRHHAQTGRDPFPDIRQAIQNDSSSGGELDAKARQAKHKLDAELVRVRRNAGSGYVGTFNHCSRAWAHFMQTHVRPLSERVSAGLERQDLDGFEAAIGELLESHKTICEDAIVRERARRIMDRAAASLASHFTDFVVAERNLRFGSPKNDSLLQKLLDSASRLASLGEPSGVVDRLIAKLLVTQTTTCDTEPQLSPLLLSLDFFLRFPSLLGYLEEVIDWSAPPSVEQLEGPSEGLAAIILHSRSNDADCRGQRDLEALCRDTRRFDWLSRVRPPLNAGDVNAAADERAQLLVARQRLKDRARLAWRALEALQVPSRDDVRDAIHWVDTASIDERDAAFVARWLTEVAAGAEQQIEAARLAWDARLASSPEDASRLAALRADNFAAAVRSGHSAPATHQPVRETPWRDEAERLFPDPRRTLLEQRASALIAEKWVGEVNMKAQRHKSLLSLLTEFTKWAFGPSLFAHGEKTQRSFTLETRLLRDNLLPRQPTYLPQLHAARRLVVATVPESPTSREYALRAVEEVNEQSENAIVALLCPGVPKATRDDILRTLQGTTHFAGLVDDLDMCRLLNPEGVQPNPIVGLCELILEQQPLKARNPFSVPEGREMRLEMYVGRREEAEQLATTSAKTRLFSGRKLGKTALLQFIRQTWNGRQLPNGAKLCVVYLSIVGVGAEELFAKKLLQQLRAEFPAVNLPESLPQPADLLDTIQRVLDASPGDELLIVLDEADQFVAEQVRKDRTHKGTGLSWKLRENSRVRFVFTGYWATSTRDGVWYNWGDVLELSQLTAEEAAGLVARPLARLGIDVGEQGDEIAFRCGYQPAVILRFGERLVERLAMTPTRGRRVVGLSLVQDVFGDSRVQAEIQDIVRANFQGNPFGQAIFYVVLRESAQAPLGGWLRGLEATVEKTFVESLRDTKQAELQGQIAAQLRDMHSRKLVNARKAGDASLYQLRFPHHLATLLADVNVQAEIDANLKAWQETGTDRGFVVSGEGRSPLARKQLALLRELIDPQFKDLSPCLIVVASSDPEMLIREPGGVPDRLGLPPHVRDIADFSPAATARCWGNAGPEHLDLLLETTHPIRPLLLFGGLPLLRAALRRQITTSSDDALEVVSTHRMSDGQIRWWFQRVLGIEFASEGDYEKVRHATGGVPRLIRRFQETLLPVGVTSGGANIGADVLQTCLTAMSESLRDRAVSEEFFAELFPRELDLLRMAATVTMAFIDPDSAQRFELEDLLTNDWTESLFGATWRQSFASHSFPPSIGSYPDDTLAMEMLTLSGLTCGRQGSGPAISRVQSFGRHDPVVTMLMAMG